MIRITEKEGDLIEAFLNKEVDVIAHQANCFCTAKSGLAPKLFEALPILRAADHRTEIGDRRKLGKVTYAKLDNQWAFNLYGQYHHEHDHPEYGTVYPFLSNALCRMALLLKTSSCSHLRIGFPLIGCGHGGGEWDKVKGLIELAFSEHKGEIVIYKLPEQGNVY